MQRSIFIIDDDMDDCFLFVEVMFKIDQSIQCTYLNTAMQAVKFFDANVTQFPDMIFLDLNLPGMDGRECLKYLRSKDVIKAVPIIILTTSNLPDDMHDTKQLGANHFITKPSKYEEWILALRAALDTTVHGNKALPGN